MNITVCVLETIWWYWETRMCALNAEFLFRCPMLVNHKMQKKNVYYLHWKGYLEVEHCFSLVCSRCVQHLPQACFGVYKNRSYEKLQSASQTSFSVGVFLYVLSHAVKGLPVSAVHNGSTIFVASRNMGPPFFMD